MARFTSQICNLRCCSTRDCRLYSFFCLNAPPPPHVSWLLVDFTGSPACIFLWVCMQAPLGPCCRNCKLLVKLQAAGLLYHLEGCVSVLPFVPIHLLSGAFLFLPPNPPRLIPRWAKCLALTAESSSPGFEPCHPTLVWGKLGSASPGAFFKSFLCAWF